MSSIKKYLPMAILIISFIPSLSSAKEWPNSIFVSSIANYEIVENKLCQKPKDVFLKDAVFGTIARGWEQASCWAVILEGVEGFTTDTEKPAKTDRVFLPLKDTFTDEFPKESMIEVELFLHEELAKLRSHNQLAQNVYAGPLTYSDQQFDLEEVTGDAKYADLKAPVGHIKIWIKTKYEDKILGIFPQKMIITEHCDLGITPADVKRHFSKLVTDN